MYSIIENRRLITAYPCFEADNDSAEPANQYTKIDSNTALILFISPLYTHSHVTQQWYAHAVYITPRGNHFGGMVTKFGKSGLHALIQKVSLKQQ